jgi:hypothetical protein
VEKNDFPSLWWLVWWLGLLAIGVVLAVTDYSTVGTVWAYPALGPIVMIASILPAVPALWGLGLSRTICICVDDGQIRVSTKIWNRTLETSACGIDEAVFVRGTMSLCAPRSPPSEFFYLAMVTEHDVVVLTRHPKRELVDEYLKSLRRVVHVPASTTTMSIVAREYYIPVIHGF